jgi:spore maturation protein CgeB
MKILSVGNMSGLSNTCLHRHWALKKIADQIDVVNTRKQATSIWYRIARYLFQHGIPVRLPDSSGSNKEIKQLIKNSINDPYQIVWIDKGITINAETLRYIKQVSPKTKIISYSPDNMALKHNQSLNFLKAFPYYDVHFTTKSYIIDEMKRLGAREVIFTNKLYEPTFHYPRELTADDLQRLGGDVGFIGAWEEDRCKSLVYLANNGIRVKVYGDGKWNSYRHIPNLEIQSGIFSDDYPKALQAFKISICFLRKLNYDLQTSRTMEIPACGGFMLAERTDEHLALFIEGKEADFFSSDEELLEKCRYYLAHEGKRLQIAAAGTLRCKTSGYSNEESIRKMLKIATNND